MRLLDHFWHKYLKRPYRLRVTADEGEGAHILVLLHGIGASSAVWQPLVRTLDHTKYRIITLDLLGFGDSPKPDWNTYTVSEHAAAVQHTLRQYGIRGRITIVAHSMGCLIASHLATKYRGSVRRLVLYQPPLLAERPASRTHEWRQQRYIAFLEYISSHPQLLMLQHHRLWAWARRVSGLVMNEDTWVPFERSLQNTIMRQTAYKELHEVSVPTDIVYGSLDFMVIRTGAKQQLQDNPYIRLHLFPEVHDITRRGAQAIIKVLAQKPPRPAKARTATQKSRRIARTTRRRIPPATP